MPGVVNQEKINELSLAIETRFRTVLASEIAEDMGDVIGEVKMNAKTVKFPLGGILADVREWVDERKHQALAAWVAALEAKKYEITVDISEDDLEDDVADISMPQIDSLAVEMANLRRDRAVTILATEGFSTDYPIWDGCSLISASHTFEGSGLDAQSNRSFLTLSQANYYTVKAAWQKLKRPNGTYFRRRRPTHFFHSMALQATADAMYKCPILSTGATNPLYGEFKPENIRAIPEFGDTVWGFCQAKGPQLPILTGVRRAVRYVAVTDPKAGGNVFEKGVFSFGFDCREITAILTWWDWAMSTGAGS